MRFKRAAFLLLLPCLGLLLAMLTGITNLLEQGFVVNGRPSLNLMLAFVDRGDAMSVFWYTHQMAAVVALICILIGYPLAAFMARNPHPAFVVLLISPLLISVVVRTYGWIVLLGPRGLVNTVLLNLGIIDARLKMLFTTGGVIIGLVHVFVPFAVLSILAVYVKLDRSLSDASMALGASRSRTFFKVTLPLTMPGVITAGTIVYLLTLGAVVTPLLLGGPKQMMLGSMIYEQMLVLFNFERAAAAAIFLTTSAAIAIIPFQLADKWFTRRLPAARS